MIFSYRNGELITEEEILLETNEEKEVLRSIKVEDEYVDLCEIPHVIKQNGATEKLAYYLQQGTKIYLIRELEQTNGDRTYLVYIIEQGVMYGKMQIKNIDSYLIVPNNEWLLKYCVPAKIDEKKNVIIGIKSILNDLKFVQDKEKEYLVNKIEEFFNNDEKQEPLIIRKKEPSGKITYENTIGGRVGNSIVYDGKLFNSISAFLREYNIAPSTYAIAKEKGMTISEIVNHYSRKNSSSVRGTSIKLPIVYDGETFQTLASFHTKYQITPSTMTKALQRGMSIEDIVKKYSNSKTRQRWKHSLIQLPFEYKGETFKSVKEFSRKYNINPSSADRGLEQGLTLDEIVERYQNRVGLHGGNKHLTKMKTLPREVVCNGVTYPSVNKFIIENNLTVLAITALKNGMPPEEIVEKFKKKSNEKRGKKPYTYEYAGQQLTLKEMAEVSGIAWETIKSRLQMGWTVEKAMETPVDKK